MKIMADEVTPPEAPAPQQGEVSTPEPQNVREAIAQRRAQGDPGFVEITEEEAHAPYSDADDDSNLFEPETAASVESAGASAPEDAAAAPADPYAEFGGREAVQDSVTVTQALKTEAGVRMIVAQGLQAIGYTPEAVAAFLANKDAAAAAAPEAPDPYAGIDDDDVVTGADVKRLLAQAAADISKQVIEANKSAVTPLQEQILEDRQRNATQAVDSTLTELLGIKDGKPDDLQRAMIADIQVFASRHIDPNSWDPNQIRQSIIAGHADMVARDEARFKAYVANKRAAKAAQPPNIGGGSPAGGEEVVEPKSVKEAIAMRKAQKIY